MSKANQRKVILINKKFQLSVIGWICFIGLIIETVFYLANYYFFKQMRDEAISAGLAPDNIFYEYLANQNALMNKIFLISTVIVVIIVVWGGLFLSHKIAGPLYRLQQHLKNNTPENSAPLKFREGDYFLEIQDAYNEFIKRN